MQQQRDSQRSLCAEASTIASQSPARLNAEFRLMEHDTCAVEGRVLQKSRWRSSQFKLSRRLMLKDNSRVRTLVRNSEEKDTVDWSSFLEDQLRNRYLVSSSESSACEAIEYERQRLRHREQTAGATSCRNDRAKQQEEKCGRHWSSSVRPTSAVLHPPEHNAYRDAKEDLAQSCLQYRITRAFKQGCRRGTVSRVSWPSAGTPLSTARSPLSLKVCALLSACETCGRVSRWWRPP